ncbi:MAG: ribosome recycling factor [Chloroflexi bacterium]|nr:ribosome recycling factor [Chloroflexota bacterium]MCL5109062.1 ribosome recycling factor [Chloroflexota bacterium]
MTEDPIQATASETESKMRKAIDALRRDLVTIRTGRASPALVERITVEYYGVPTPLSQVASIAAPEARLLVIQPWDKNVLSLVEKAILKSELGITPNNDGRVIRLAIPQLSEERRKDLVKVVHRKVEETRVALRNLRRDGVEELKEFEKEKMITEDDLKDGQEGLQKLTDHYIQDAERVGQAKEHEILEV